MTEINLPEAFVSRLRGEGSLDADALVTALGGEPVVGVRLNPAKPAVTPAWLDDAERVPWSCNGFYPARRPEFTLEPTFHGGGMYVQDPSSMVHERIVAHLTADGNPVRLLDVCAAPGGKTTAAIASLPPGSMAVANEVMPDRARVLAENVVKWGYPGSIVTSAPAAALGKLGPLFDIMIVDAPCSGEGMMRKDAKAVEQWSPGLVGSCARLQREILTDALTALRPGGYLIYSTCTFSRAENEEMVEWLADSYGMESIDPGLDACGVPRGWSDRVVTWRFMPHLTRGEGLFVAVLRLPEGVAQGGKRKAKKEKRASKALNINKLPAWVSDIDSYTPFDVEGTVHLIPSSHSDIFAALRAGGIRMLAAGVAMGEWCRDTLVPAHALVMSTALADGAFPDVALSREEALSYLRRDAVALPPDTPRGFVTVNCDGCRLGLMKNIGNRANNLYPTAWRIRNK